MQMHALCDASCSIEADYMVNLLCLGDSRIISAAGVLFAVLAIDSRGIQFLVSFSRA